MITKTIQGGHSARVKMKLLAGDSSVQVVQLGPDFLLLETPLELPPGEASVVMQVDQSERRWKVRLPEGSSAGSAKVAIIAGD